MKLLITGAAGFIGSHLVDRLASEDRYDLVLFDNLHRGRLENITQHRHNPRITFIRGDLRTYEQVVEAMTGCEKVIHLGAQSNVLGAVTDLDYSFQSNVIGTFHVLKAARQTGVRSLVFTSSREVYGEPRHLPVDEEQPTYSKNTYGASKLSGEMYCRVFREMFGLNTIILRLTNVYGPRDYGRVIPLWIQRAIDGTPLQVYGGEQVIDFIWIDRVVDALVRSMEVETVVDPINIGSGKGVEILNLARQILELTNSSSELVLLPPRFTDVVKFTARVERMQEILGVIPPEDPLEFLPELIRNWE